MQVWNVCTGTLACLMTTNYYQQTSRCNKYNVGIIAECSCRRWQLIHSIVDSGGTSVKLQQVTVYPPSGGFYGSSMV